MLNNVYEISPVLKDPKQDSHSKACSEVLSAINDLRTTLQKKQMEGNLKPEIAENLQAQLDALTSSTINYQQKQLK